MNSVLKNDVPDKVFSMIGLATKAGKTFSGEFSVEKAVKEKSKTGYCIGRCIGQYKEIVY